VPDQCHSRRDRGLRDAVAAATAENQFQRTGETGWSLAGRAGDGASRAHDRLEGSAAARLAVARLRFPAARECGRYRLVRAPLAAFGPSGGAVGDAAATLVRDRMRPELLSRC